MPDTKVFVLDNGHGGQNEGLNYRGFLEKDMNLIVANAMKDTLSQFDNVEVYITNPEKKDMSLKERAQYAESVGADVIICLHFNMSEEHTMYGSEVFIPSRGLGYSKMHSLGDLFLDEFAQKGLTIRGVKNRLNDNGDDYYGIIRESEALGIPCVLVEHAYADHDRDLPYIQTEEDLKDFGILDARAVAKYYHLKSSSLGTDYTNFVKNAYFAPEEAVGSDTSEPQQATLVWLGEEGEYTKADTQSFILGAVEQESLLVYYDYSIDGGESWSELFPFERGKSKMEISMQGIVPGSKVVARIYNGYYLYAETNTIAYTPLAEKEVSQSDNTDYVTNVQGNDKDNSSVREGTEEMLILQQNASKSDITSRNEKITPYLFCGFGLFLAFMLFLASYLTYRMGERRRDSKRERMLFISALCVLIVSVTSMGMVYASRVSMSKTADSEVDISQAQYDELNNKNDEMSEAELVNDRETEPAQPGEEQPDDTTPYILTLTGENGRMENLAAVEVPLQEEENTAVIYDIAEGYLRVPLLADVPKNPYRLEAFQGTDLEMRYQGDDANAILGIDVSKFQGDIDFEQVKEAGVEFVMIRLGLRGYGSGKLVMDESFYSNMKKAREAGLKTGVYFFSAAINEEEAIEEARYVMDAIAGYEIDMPVVFDTEPILYDVARTDHLTPNQLTKITKAFCEEIKQNGYTPMIYANAKRFTTVLHLEQLGEYELWLADYRQAPDFPYAFKMWQFTEHGRVPGIDAEVDIDLYFID